MMTKNEKIGVLLKAQEKLVTLLVNYDDERIREEFHRHYKEVAVLDYRIKGIKDAICAVSGLIQEERAK